MRRKQAGVRWTAAPPNATFRRRFTRLVRNWRAAELVTADTVHMEDEPSCATASRPMPDAGMVVVVETVAGEEHDTGRSAERIEAMENTLGAVAARVMVDAAVAVSA